MNWQPGRGECDRHRARFGRCRYPEAGQDFGLDAIRIVQADVFAFLGKTAAQYEPSLPIRRGPR